MRNETLFPLLNDEQNTSLVQDSIITNSLIEGAKYRLNWENFVTTIFGLQKPQMTTKSTAHTFFYVMSLKKMVDLS